MCVIIYKIHQYTITEFVFQINVSSYKDVCITIINVLVQHNQFVSLLCSSYRKCEEYSSCQKNRFFTCMKYIFYENSSGL